MPVEVGAVAKFLQRHPNGSHTAEARKTLEALTWKETAAANTSASYAVYLERYPGGAHAKEAKASLDDLRWLEPRLSKLSAPDLLAVAKSYEHLLQHALMVMQSFGTPLSVVATEEGHDLMLNGIEVGSYGHRSIPGIETWAYGTGLALPRFSVASAKG